MKKNDDDVRFQAHECLLKLDAATVEMMKLVTLDQLGGPEWYEAVKAQRQAYETLHKTLADVSPE
ncbi:hypothetical protein [Pseudomonas huanghezhanensis]|uniref:hypothetical protein n=1 Tax=Pseudomonas huanghezhanensis TaxID=3002903 RepID=UPI0022869EA9|nr:hypothetical protein [Pseudomonas sp. BSw22131]